MWKNNVRERIQPPPVRVQPGRPKRNRRKSKDEPKKFKPGEPQKMSRQGISMSCGNFGQLGHNIRTCKNRKNTEDTSQGPFSQNSQTSTMTSSPSQRKRKSQKDDAPSTSAKRPRVEVKSRNAHEGVWIREGSGRKTTAKKGEEKAKPTSKGKENAKGREMCKTQWKRQCMPCVVKGKEKEKATGKSKQETMKGRPKEKPSVKGKKETMKGKPKEKAILIVKEAKGIAKGICDMHL